MTQSTSKSAYLFRNQFLELKYIVALVVMIGSTVFVHAQLDMKERFAAGYQQYDKEITSLSSYYVSSSIGDDAYLGTVNDRYKSLEKISTIPLSPGDTVLFMCGDTLNGHFIVNGSGTEEMPILITSYGVGPLPVLSSENNLIGPVKISLYDIKGRMILSNQLSNTGSRKVFDIKIPADLRNGIYILNIENNGHYHSRRLMLFNPD